MKDVTKIISERATRFLPVDMKDRLKSAFNRSTGGASANSSPDDVPDYSAIFNANRSPGNQKAQRFNGPLDQTQLAEPPSSATMRNPARQIAHEIEEAEVVTDGELAADSDWESASLKNRKTEAFVEPRQASPTPEVVNDGPDYSATSRSNKSKSASSKPARPQFDASAYDRSSAEGRLETDAESRKFERPRPAVKADETRPVSKKEMRPVAKEVSEPARDIEAKYDSSSHQEVEAEKPRSRFFGDSPSTESVRLKVDKRNDDHPTTGPIPSNGNTRPEPKPFEAKARTMGEPITTGSGYQAKLDADPGTTEAVALRPATSERANLNPQKENASMDVNGHESENGATIRTDSDGSVAAIAIERNSKFSGQLKFSGAIAIDGHVDGELVAERIVVHEGGVVNATIEGNTVVIAGTVKGDVYARNELEILPSGIVHGSVTAPSINVRRGGRIEGRCAIGVPRQ